MDFTENLGELGYYMRLFEQANGGIDNVIADNQRSMARPPMVVEQKADIRPYMMQPIDETAANACAYIMAVHYKK